MDFLSFRVFSSLLIEFVTHHKIKVISKVAPFMPVDPSYMQDPMWGDMLSDSIET